MSNNECSQVKKVKVVHTRLPSVVKCTLVNTGKGEFMPRETSIKLIGQQEDLTGPLDT